MLTVLRRLVCGILPVDTRNAATYIKKLQDIYIL